MQRIGKVIASILICIIIFASIAAIYLWSIGLDPIGGFIYSFLMTLFYGSWLFIIALFLLFTITSYYKKANVYVLAGSLMGFILPVFTGMNFFDIQGFPVDFIGYFMSGAMFGWLYSKWILKKHFS